MKSPIVTVAIVIVVAIIAFFVGRHTCVYNPGQKSLSGVDKDQVEKKITVTFPGAEKHEVSLAEAKQYLQNYRKSLQAQKTKTPQIQGGSFDRGAIEKILAQSGCAHLRIYYGRDEKGKPNLVLVGVDTVGKDMTKACIMDRSSDCPPWCDATSELIK